MSVLLIALVLLATGLDGAYRYWESYYQHRGFNPVALLAGARPGQRVWVHFYSPALRRQADYLTYLPPGYDPRRRYPVYYLLHGSPGRPQVYTTIASMPTRMDNLLSRHRMTPMILVFPDGRIAQSTYSDSEWANTGAGRYESYVLDVVRSVDARFATIVAPSARVIAGFSAGAYGATNVALHHPDVFGNLQSWSGYYRQSRIGVFAHSSAARLAANSPMAYVNSLGPRLAAHPLRAFLFVGRDDNVSPQEKRLALALGRVGAQVSYALYRGGHDWQLWHAHLNQMLILASRDSRLGRPIGGAGGARALTPGVTPLPRGLGRHHHRRGRHHRHGHRRSRHRHQRHRHLSPFPSIRPRRLELVAQRTGLVHRHTWLAPQSSLSTRGPPPGRLLAGLLLALGSAALINLGFLLQHRGLRGSGGGGLVTSLRRAARHRTWLGGQLLGWVGFAAQILAVAIAPLALVQAFAAGGLALSVPIAARLFGHRISRRQRTAVLVIALSLAALPLGYGAAHDQLATRTLGISVAVAALVAVALSSLGASTTRAAAAGIFYGAADAAIKAISVRWGADGWAALVSVWTPVAGLGTFAGFLAFQSALRANSAISAISLMNGLAALVALACGLLAFGESLGTDPVAVVIHLGAIALVLACVPQLAAAQAEIADATPPAHRQAPPSRTAADEQGPAWQSAADGEQQRLQPRPPPGDAVLQNPPKAEIPGQRIGSLGGEQQ